MERSIITAFEDNSHKLSDPRLLDRATELNRVLFTQDDDLLAEAAHRQRLEIPFSGVIYAHQMTVNIGQCIADLELIAQVENLAKIQNTVIFLQI